MAGPNRLLLDTPVVLWWLADDPTLDDEIKTMIDHELDVSVSAVVLWEIMVKQNRGKIRAPDDLMKVLGDNFYELPIEFEHTVELGSLPLLHRDPFDRMLIAQARTERMTLLTRDQDVRRYDVSILTV